MSVMWSKSIVKNSSVGFLRQNLTGPRKQPRKSFSERAGTIDQADIDHLSSLSNDWWSSKRMKPLLSMNNVRVPLIRDGMANAGHIAKNISLPLENLRILDVGCGGGILSEALGRIGAQVTGIDPSNELLSVAKQHVKLDSEIEKRLNYLHITIEEFATKEVETFDAVVASEVFEHVSDPSAFLKYCVETLKPGGSIFITTFNKTAISWLGGIIAAEYIFRAIPRGTHHWDKFVPLEETIKLLEQYNCKTKLIHGMMYNPFKSSWVWSNSTSMTYGLHAVKTSEKSTT